MPRHLRSALPALGLALLVALGFGARGAGASTTAPTSVPVVFVHGFFADHCPTSGLNVASAMAGPVQQLTASGWHGTEDVVSYYACDVGGDRIASDTTNTPIETIAKQLAWHIYNRYTSHGQTVDVVAHSMGGLITRAALVYTQQHTSGFPTSLLVRRVVTFSTPHAGILAGTVALVPGLTGTYQGKEVVAGSAFLRSLGTAAPQGVGGTVWLVVGSSGTCDLVPGISATALVNAVHVLYAGCWTHVSYLLPQTVSLVSALLNGLTHLSIPAPLVLMTNFLAAG